MRTSSLIAEGLVVITGIAKKQTHSNQLDRPRMMKEKVVEVWNYNLPETSIGYTWIVLLNDQNYFINGLVTNILICKIHPLEVLQLLGTFYEVFDICLGAFSGMKMYRLC